MSYMFSYQFRERFGYPILFIGPTILFLLGLIAYPISYSIVISFKQFIISTRGPRPWDGLGNYRYLIGDPVFWKSIWITVSYSLVVTIGSFLVGFVCALLVQGKKFPSLYISLFLLPIIVPPIVTGFMFRILFNDNYGIINYWLSVFGLNPPNWLGDPAMARVTLMLVGIWSNFSLVTIISLGGLNSVPTELYESAELDGANSIQKLLHITIPVIRSILASVIILTLITTMKVYDTAVTLTAGGPGTATLTLTYYANVVGFQTYNLGRAAASSLVAFVLIVGATVGLSTMLYKRGRD